jgi:hypothetical protein
MIADFLSGIVVIVALGVMMIPVGLGLLWIAESAEVAILGRMNRR